MKSWKLASFQSELKIIAVETTHTRIRRAWISPATYLTRPLHSPPPMNSHHQKVSMFERFLYINLHFHIVTGKGLYPNEHLISAPKCGQKIPGCIVGLRWRYDGCIDQKCLLTELWAQELGHPANPWPGGFWSGYCWKIIISKKSILPGRSFSWLLGLEILFVLVFFGSTCESWILLVRNKTGGHMGDRFQRLEMQKSCAPTWEVLPTTWNTFLFCRNLLMAWPAGCYDVWCLAKMRGYWTPDHFIFYQEFFTGWNTVFHWCNCIFAISQLFSVFGDLPTPSTMNPLNNWILTSGQIIAALHDLTPKGS